MSAVVDSEVTVPGENVKDFFGSSFATMSRYAEMLVEQGELRGLLGPRELPRLWSRHLLNCAAAEKFLPLGRNVTVADVGSGAGLPGVVLAIMRPDLPFYLIEPLARRSKWLEEVQQELKLKNVEVLRSRSQDLPPNQKFTAVTSRAVANLQKLVRISGRLVAPGGRMLAIKGERAPLELAAAQEELVAARLEEAHIEEVPSVMDDSVTRVIMAIKRQ
ncbi:16S rRNA (guanine(527)-N(7))-methyltransferase RsmG [Varibaculum vaginae]|uniref:16S rRNA (guanine(527)-N(7))-methyltransferase RsmG n=1 Tax=Varibaculum vaginae TaxID=2364797 RepID=UPI000F08E747|nr:16S rRNA (guanine(527)-N(7))-methyltransferase RsmG [Varibaculum vaginae]